jgi:hypothetical protein
VDPTGLLDAVLAVAVYPGAAFLAAAALLHGAMSGRRLVLRHPAGALPTVTLLTAVAAIVATAMLPLPGSPALRLPPPAGATGNVVAVIVLLAIAVDLGALSRRVAALAAAAAVPVLALAAAGSTVNAAAISTAHGALGAGARVSAAAVLLLAASSSAGDRAASAVVAALGLTAASLVIPAALPDGTPALSAAACLGVVAISGVLARIHDRWSAATLAAIGSAGALAGTVLALLSGRT